MSSGWSSVRSLPSQERFSFGGFGAVLLGRLLLGGLLRTLGLVPGLLLRLLRLFPFRRGGDLGHELGEGLLAQGPLRRQVVSLAVAGVELAALADRHQLALLAHDLEPVGGQVVGVDDLRPGNVGQLVGLHRGAQVDEAVGDVLGGDRLVAGVGRHEHPRLDGGPAQRGIQVLVQVRDPHHRPGQLAVREQPLDRAAVPVDVVLDPVRADQGRVHDVRLVGPGGRDQQLRGGLDVGPGDARAVHDDPDPLQRLGQAHAGLEVPDEPVRPVRQFGGAGLDPGAVLAAEDAHVTAACDQLADELASEGPGAAGDQDRRAHRPPFRSSFQGRRPSGKTPGPVRSVPP